MNARTLQRHAHGHAAAALRVAIDNGELADLLADDYTDDDLDRLLAMIARLADRHAARASR